jgi:hypothetical protein
MRATVPFVRPDSCASRSSVSPFDHPQTANGSRECEVGLGAGEVILSRLDPELLDFGHDRAAQKARYGGEFFPSD